MDAILPPDVLIASSTSSLPITDMQAGGLHPEPCVLGHPFTPTHLLRLVEVVGGTQTAPEAVDAAIVTCDHWGKVSVRLNREVFGHIGNRLATALWCEEVDACRGFVGDDEAYCFPDARHAIPAPPLAQTPQSVAAQAQAHL